MPKIDEKKFLLIIIFLHLVITLPLAYFLNVWADEASTLATTNDGFFQTFNNFYNEKQAPLYFFLIGLWRELNDSIFFARLFSIICSALAIRFFFHLAKKIFTRKAALFITAFFALHPFLIWASLEIRVYSLVILLSILLLTLFNEGFLNKQTEDARKYRIFYILTSIFALYTNYYLGFLLVGNFAALLILKRRSEAQIYFRLMLIVGAAILPLLSLVNLQFGGRAAVFQAEKSVVEIFRILWNHFLTFILPTEIYPGEEISYFSIFRVWFVRLGLLAIIVAFIKKRLKADENTLTFGAIVFVINLFLFAVYFVLSSDLVAIRHAAVLFAPMILFAALILTKILPAKSRIFAAVLLAIFFAYSISALYPNLAKRGDWARVAAFIEQNETPDQPIFVHQIYDVLSLRAHYRGANRILPDEKILDWGLEDEFGSPQTFIRQIEFIISKIPPDAREIWIVTDESCQTTKACLPLENFINANYTIVQEKDFYLERVRLLRKKEK
jgi:uncharacterized membrane protein